MAFIACSKADSSDTMRGKLMLAWYQGACTAGVLVDTLELMTEGHVLASVSSDYRAMENMMFGEKPVFDQILAVLQSLQEEINA